MAGRSSDNRRGIQYNREEAPRKKNISIVWYIAAGISLVIIGAVAALMITRFGKEPAPTGNSGTESRAVAAESTTVSSETSSPPAAATAPTAATVPTAPTAAPQGGGYEYKGPRLTIGGSDSTGTMYAAAVAIATTFTNSINGMNVDATTSSGSIENAMKVNNGEIQLGMCSGDFALNAVNGTGKFADRGRQENIVAIGAVYPSLSNWIALKSSGYTYLHDAKGSFGIGPNASTSETSALLGLETVGITRDNATLINVTLGEGADHVADGILDASTAFAGVPVGALSNAAETKDCVLLGFTDEELDKIVAANAAYYKAVIPAGTYKGQDADVPTFGVKCMVIANKDLGFDEAYQMAKTLCEQADKMIEGNKFFYNMADKSFIATDLPISLHPGAEAYYREIGILRDPSPAEPETAPTEDPGTVAQPTTAAPTQSPLAGTYPIKVWVPEGAVELTRKQINDFNSSNLDGIRFEAAVEAVSEADAGTFVTTDVDSAADLYFFAQDQFARLVLAGALAQLGQGAADIVKDTNDAGAVRAASIGGDLYAYPLTADNGYFMYYDKSVIPTSHLGSLEVLIADCERAGKYFAMELENSAWYAISFFFGAGCVSEWTVDHDGKFIAVNDDINSDKGLISAKGMKTLLSSRAHIESSDVGEFSNGAAVVVSGPWAYNYAKGILGDNLGAAELPSFTVDGRSYHMGNFSGYKLLGVKPATDSARSASLHKLAQYLTGEQCQLERFRELAWGPSNKTAQQNADVKSNPSLVALTAQAPYSRVQGNIPGSWWDIGRVIATDVKAARDEAGLKAALESYNTKIQKIVKIDTTGYILVGAWNGWRNDDDAYRMEVRDGAFMFTLEVPLSDYMGGRIVKPGDWGTDRGCLIVTQGLDLLDMVGDPYNSDNNIIFKAPGTYVIVYDEAAGTISIRKAD